MTEILLNEDEKDCLQELMNIAYGSATAAITEILDAFATLSIPDIKIINASELKPYLNQQILEHDSHYVSTQLINGEISGENLFIIDKDSTINMARKFDLTDEGMEEEDLCDIVLEITNILSSATISKLAENMETSISFSPPDIKLVHSIFDLDNRFIEKYQKVIIISTELNFDDLNIKGELMLLTTDDSILYIKQLLNKILEEF